MRFNEIAVHPFLQCHIERMWVFENEGKMPTEAVNLVVPNGRIKLLVPFRNTIAAQTTSCYHQANEHSLTLTGLIDGPCSVYMGGDEVTGTIGIEFSPLGAYRFFPLRLSEIRNQLHPLADVFGPVIRQLEDDILQTPSVEGKVQQLQQFLLSRYLRQKEDKLFEYCTDQILSSKGRITVGELAQKTGYSSRWLNLKFDERLGINPKTLASIIRFRHCYQLMADHTQQALVPTQFYDFYYDQSHFIKAFRRFTGYTPTAFDRSSNEFGKIFYRE